MSNLSRRTFLAIAAAAGGCGTIPIFETASLLDDDPGRPMKLIVPAPAGTRIDIAGRHAAAGLATQLGEPVHVANYDGTSAAAHAAIAAAPPDGRTLGLVTVDIATMHW